jgi:hypothetical protein
MEEKKRMLKEAQHSCTLLKNIALAHDIASTWKKEVAFA